MRKHGFKPVPLRHQSKAAISRDYALLDYNPPDDTLWRNNDYGVGCVTGPLHGGPIDVDLDCDEAVFFASIFLPSTSAVFGRKSKPRSHYLYKVDVPAFDKQAFLDPLTKKTIIEIRGDGGNQTVFPGSLHEGTGETVEWSAPEITPLVPNVKSDDLVRAVRKIALATLLVRHVWQPGYHNEPSKHLAGMFYRMEWPLTEAEQFISALQKQSGDRDKTRLMTVRNTYKRGEAGKLITGSGQLEKQLNNKVLFDRIMQLAGSPHINLLNDYNERYAVVAMGGKFRIADFNVGPTESPVFMYKEDFLNWTATDYTDVEGSDKPVSKGKLWLANPRRRAYRDVEFLPGDTETSVLNLWRGWAVEPSEDGSCDGWLDLLHFVICGGDEALSRWFLHWFANILREPASKPLTAPVIIGKQGAGKSLLINYFGKILGDHYTVVTNEEHIYGKFNAHHGTTLLLHSEEALWGGDKKHRGIIKDLITGETCVFERKGIDAILVRDYKRLILTSNDAHAAPTEAGDRRFTVADMSDRMITDDLRDKVVHEMKNGGPARLLKYLLEMEYDPKLPRVNVKNEALAAMKDTNLPPAESWWFEALKEGTLLPEYLMWASRPSTDYWPTTVSKQALYNYMAITLRDWGAKPPTPPQFGILLKKWLGGGVMLKDGQRDYDNPLLDDAPPIVKRMGARQNSILNMPTLAESRAAFERYKGGGAIDWPEEAPARVQKPHERF